MNLPVLLIFFNRPEMLRRSLELLTVAGATEVYLSCDGPREGNAEDVDLVNECRRIADHYIEGKQGVRKRYSEVNLGCGLGVVSAIDWFFESVDFGIVLEDDCHPTECFYHYVELARSTFENETEIWHIGGCNPISSTSESGGIHKTKYNHIWGWATWSRYWSEFSEYFRNAERWDATVFQLYLPSDIASVYRKKMVSCIRKEVDTWDYQWFAFRLARGLAVVSEANLVLNSGFGPGATHTKSVSEEFESQKYGKFTVNDLWVDGPDSLYEARWEKFVRQVMTKSLARRILRLVRKCLK